MASQSSGKPHVQAGASAAQHDSVVDSESGRTESGCHASPLTYGKVFGEIPRVTGVNTPNINDRIAKKWGLPEVASSVEFRKVYTDGRTAMRYGRISYARIQRYW